MEFLEFVMQNKGVFLEPALIVLLFMVWRIDKRLSRVEIMVLLGPGTNRQIQSPANGD